LKSDLIHRELSWLAFNARVLQEAEDKTVPLIERVKFLGIYSNNQDEFFRVRVAGLKRISILEETTSRILGESPTHLLNTVQNKVNELKDRFDEAYNQILKDLEKENIYIINEKELDKDQSEFVVQYFQDEVRPTLYPVILAEKKKFPRLDDKSIHLAIRLVQKNKKGKKEAQYSIIKIPSKVLSRFLILPEKNGKKYIILLDDVIRHNLADIYHIFDFNYAEAYTIKVTREAELSLQSDFSESLLDALEKGLKNRDKGEPTRLVFDRQMPDGFKKFMIKKMKLKRNDTIISGSRYHNFKDFIDFPDLGRPDLLYKKRKCLEHPLLKNAKSLIEVIKRKDVLLSVPYQSFTHLLDLLREAAIDPDVTKISMTFYRVAKDSNVVNALINAVRNGKTVLAVVEPLARFDERSNINLANRLRDEGAQVVFGVRGVKVHSKMILIERRNGENEKIACISTGNFNEKTSRTYSDHILMTAHNKITTEVKRLFDFFSSRLILSKYETLMVAPLNFRKKMIFLINKEIKNAKAGLKAELIFKSNHLSDDKLIKKLYEASDEGVKIKLLVRTTCGVVPQQKFSKNIKAKGLIDRYLEHARMYQFHNNGNPIVYIGSGDLFARNFDYRIEVLCPIFDDQIKKTLIDLLAIEWKDNTKARVWDKNLKNKYEKTNSHKSDVNAQSEIYKYLKQGEKEQQPKKQEAVKEVVDKETVKEDVSS